MRGIVAIALLASACSFTPGALPIDAPPDGPPPVTVGFAKDTTLADEASMDVAIRVVLSQPADETITVGYAITGGTATQTVDYLGTDGMLTFAPGDVEEVITIRVGPDATEEPDETVELELQSVSGAGAVISTRAHVMTISANVLPRVNFALAQSMDSESMTTKTFDVTLTAASQLQVSVQLVATGTATGGGTDYTLAATTVQFAPGDTMEQATLTINNDPLDEDNETTILTLDNAVNVIIGATSAHTYTIEDNDNPPTAQFAAASSTIGEDGTGIDVIVTLSAASGKTVTVPFMVASSSSATGTDDYAIPTAMNLVFNPSVVQQIIRVNMVQDTAVESPETVDLSLGAPTNASLSLTDPTTHTVTITDDDQSCLGSGSYRMCVATPTQPVTLTGTIDTSTDTAPCSTLTPSGWTGQPDACFVFGTDITVGSLVNSSPLNVVGNRPLVLFATGNITILRNIDAAGHVAGGAGPGAGIGCGNYTDIPADSSSGGGGGAGGSFRTAGGNGGQGNGAGGSGGGALGAAGVPTTLRGGCTGQNGGDGEAANGGIGGGGGGSLYLVAGTRITIALGVSVNVSGGGGRARTSPQNGEDAGGGGGGSGGMIKLDAPAYTVTGAILVANGGGGGGGGNDNNPGESGEDPDPSNPTQAAAGGTPGGSGGADGGSGWPSNTRNGANGASNEGGGGGGGGGGYIVSNVSLTNLGATISAGDIDP